MHKTLFTDNEIKTLVETIGAKLQVSINKAGNVKVINNNEPANTSYYGRTVRGFWVLYKDADSKFIWRRHDGIGNCYPLNMRGRKVKDNVNQYYNPVTGRIKYSGYRPYNVEMSKFNTFDEALNYFVNYLKKYRGIIMKNISHVSSRSLE